MAKLPFVVQPRRKPILETLGDDDIGSIAIERRGYLTVGEKATVQNSLSEDTSMAELYALAMKIGNELNEDPQEVVTDLFEQKDAKYQKWSDEITKKFSNLTAFQSTSKLVQVTVLINSRCDSKWDIKQTMELHPDLLDLLGDFYNDEESKSLKAFEEDKKEESNSDDMAEVVKD